MDTEMITAIIAEVLDIPAEKIRGEDSFFDDLGADSFEVMQIVMKIEDTFRISISDESLGTLIRVSDAFRIVREVE